MTFGTIRTSLYSSVVLLGIAIVVPAYADNIFESQVSVAINLAGGGEVGVAEYFMTEHKWPAHLSDVYTAAAERPAGKYVGIVGGKGEGNTYVIQAIMRSDMYELEALKGKVLFYGPPMAEIHGTAARRADWVYLELSIACCCRHRVVNSEL
jgi:hypothetical protein